MSQNRSHLVPTPTVDKNGVLTTRHKKPENTSGDKANSIPQVSVMQESPSYVEGSIEHLADLVYGQDSAAYSEVFRLMREDDKTTAPLGVRLITTGSELAKSEVRTVIDRAVSELFYAHNESDINDLWRDRCHNSWSPVIKNHMVAAWNIGNVIEETGCTLRPSFMHGDIIDLDAALNPLGTYGDRSRDTVYWRGLAAVVATDLGIGEGRKQDARPFALWAGKREDLSRIVTLAKERRTLSPSNLQGIMDEQDRAAAPLREGTL